MQLYRGEIGFILGRLSPLRLGKIQSFPWGTWEYELEIAAQNNLNIIEWTIDSERIQENPLIQPHSEDLKHRLSQCTIKVPSVTCDYYMENPHWKCDPDEISKVIQNILIGMKTIGAKILVIPLVDNSSIANSDFNDWRFFHGLEDFLIRNETQIAFEVDLPPEKAANFISEFDPHLFGINYDIGNSASLGFDVKEEFEAYGPRVINVHVKDRVLNGPTVPLGKGNADFKQVFQLLRDYSYAGNYILQTARASSDNHLETLLSYKQFVERMQFV